MRIVQSNHTQALDNVQSNEERIGGLEEEIERLLNENLKEMRSDITSNSQHLVKCADALATNVEILDDLKTTFNDLTEQISKLTQEPTTTSEEFEQKMENEVDELSKKLTEIETKLPGNTDFREIIEAQTRKFLEENPELLKPSSKLSTEVKALTNNYKVMSDRVEHIEATAKKFAEDKLIADLRAQMQEKYDNLETKYVELKAQVDELSEKQANP